MERLSTIGDRVGLVTVEEDLSLRAGERWATSAGVPVYIPAPPPTAYVLRNSVNLHGMSDSAMDKVLHGTRPLTGGGSEGEGNLPWPLGVGGGGGLGGGGGGLTAIAYEPVVANRGGDGRGSGYGRPTPGPGPDVLRPEVAAQVSAMAAAAGVAVSRPGAPAFSATSIGAAPSSLGRSVARLNRTAAMTPGEGRAAPPAVSALTFSSFASPTRILAANRSRILADGAFSPAATAATAASATQRTMAGTSSVRRERPVPRILPPEPPRLAVPAVALPPAAAGNHGGGGAREVAGPAAGLPPSGGTMLLRRATSAMIADEDTDAMGLPLALGSTTLLRPGSSIGAAAASKRVLLGGSVGGGGGGGGGVVGAGGGVPQLAGFGAAMLAALRRTRPGAVMSSELHDAVTASATAANERWTAARDAAKFPGAAAGAGSDTLYDIDMSQPVAVPRGWTGALHAPITVRLGWPGLERSAIRMQVAVAVGGAATCGDLLEVMAGAMAALVAQDPDAPALVAALAAQEPLPVRSGRIDGLGEATDAADLYFQLPSGRIVALTAPVSDLTLRDGTSLTILRVSAATLAALAAAPAPPPSATKRSRTAAFDTEVAPVQRSATLARLQHTRRTALRDTPTPAVRASSSGSAAAADDGSGSDTGGDGGSRGGFGGGARARVLAAYGGGGGGAAGGGGTATLGPLSPAAPAAVLPSLGVLADERYVMLPSTSWRRTATPPPTLPPCPPLWWRAPATLPCTGTAPWTCAAWRWTPCCPSATTPSPCTHGRPTSRAACRHASPRRCRPWARA